MPGNPRIKSVYLTPEEAATVLLVTRRTVYEWLRSGELPSLRFGKMWRIRREDVFKKSSPTGV